MAVRGASSVRIQFHNVPLELPFPPGITNLFTYEHSYCNSKAKNEFTINTLSWSTMTWTICLIQLNWTFKMRPSSIALCTSSDNIANSFSCASHIRSKSYCFGINWIVWFFHTVDSHWCQYTSEKLFSLDYKHIFITKHDLGDCGQKGWSNSLHCLAKPSKTCISSPGSSHCSLTSCKLALKMGKLGTIYKNTFRFAKTVISTLKLSSILPRIRNSQDYCYLWYVINNNNKV